MTGGDARLEPLATFLMGYQDYAALGQDVMADETATPRFSSATESPAQLLARVRERLAREAAADAVPDRVAAAPREGPLDFASGRGLLHGWYSQEAFGDFTFRWTERRFGFEADVDDATHLRMEASLFPESGLRELRVRLRVDERDAGAAPIRKAGARFFSPFRKAYRAASGSRWTREARGARRKRVCRPTRASSHWPSGGSTWSACPACLAFPFPRQRPHPPRPCPGRFAGSGGCSGPGAEPPHRARR